MKHIIAALLASTMFGSTAFATEPTNQTHIWPTGTVLMADGAFQSQSVAINLSSEFCFTPVNLPLGATLTSIVIPGNVTVRVGLYAPSNGSNGPGSLDWDLGVTSYSSTTGLSSANFPNGSYNAGSGGIHWIGTLTSSSNTSMTYVGSGYSGGAVNTLSFAAVGTIINSNSSYQSPISVGNTLCTSYTYGALPVTPPTNLYALPGQPYGTLLVGLYH